jgi:hypothetical protein
MHLKSLQVHETLIEVHKNILPELSEPCDHICVEEAQVFFWIIMFLSRWL